MMESLSRDLETETAGRKRNSLEKLQADLFDMVYHVHCTYPLLALVSLAVCTSLAIRKRLGQSKSQRARL